MNRSKALCMDVLCRLMRRVRRHLLSSYSSIHLAVSLIFRFDLINPYTHTHTRVYTFNTYKRTVHWISPCETLCCVWWYAITLSMPHIYIFVVLNWNIRLLLFYSFFFSHEVSHKHFHLKVHMYCCCGFVKIPTVVVVLENWINPI